MVSLNRLTLILKISSSEHLPMLDALTELGEVFSIDSLIEYMSTCEKFCMTARDGTDHNHLLFRTLATS